MLTLKMLSGKPTIMINEQMRIKETKDHKMILMFWRDLKKPIPM